MPATGVAEPAAVATLFLCGDLMTGRGIDQILPHPADPRLFEAFVQDARRYVELAEVANGPVDRRRPWDAVWGEALGELRRRRPAVRIVNLETAVTAGGEPWPKGINYRMHPDNLPLLTEAGVDCCVLANNHVLDWGRAGLEDTLGALDAAGIVTAGAGADAAAAWQPAVLGLAGRRLLVFAAATGDSGVPPEGAAGARRAGVNRLPDLSDETLVAVAAQIRRWRRPGDRVLFSVHWGGNWGFDIPDAQRRFARGLVDVAGVDLVHGHSSHHVKGLECHAGRLILYGCGDLLNDYEGIGGHEAFRGELGLMYFPELDPATGRLRRLEMVPTRLRRLRLELARGADRDWLLETLGRECRRLGGEIEPGPGGSIVLAG